MRVWNQDDMLSDWSPIQLFDMGFIDQSMWKKEATIFTLHVIVPPNTTSTIKAPILEGSRMELYESGSVLVKEANIEGEVIGIEVSEIYKTEIVLEVVSGKYKFELLY